jgi:hypothetical protein
MVLRRVDVGMIDIFILTLGVADADNGELKKTKRCKIIRIIVHQRLSTKSNVTGIYILPEQCEVGSTVRP